MSEQKIYVGSGKKKFDNLHSINICLTDIPKEHVFEYNDKKYIRLNVHTKSDVDRFGKDVSVSIDTWKPEKGSEPVKDSKNDLPF